MIEKRETLEQFAQHADKLGEVRLAGAVAMGSWYYVTAEDLVLYLTILYLLLQIGIIIPKYMPLVKRYFGKSKKRRKND